MRRFMFLISSRGRADTWNENRIRGLESMSTCRSLHSFMALHDVFWPWIPIGQMWKMHFKPHIMQTIEGVGARLRGGGGEGAKNDG